MPILGDPNHKSIISSLKNRIPQILGLNTPAATPPRAIILITAHWTTSSPTISSAASHELLYDYYGFPPESYSLKYPAPGSPSLAKQLASAISAEGLTPILDDKRGWDHGVFVPLTLAAPKADIPIVQVSVLESEDPDAHLRLGKALATLREDNVAIVGSGFASFHNLGIMQRLMRSDMAQQRAFRETSDAWNKALTDAVATEKVDARWDALRKWRDLPNADTMHPPRGGEHFMPLLVCAGAAGKEQAKMYKDDFLGTDIFTYYWGAEQVA